MPTQTVQHPLEQTHCTFCTPVDYNRKKHKHLRSKHPLPGYWESGIFLGLFQRFYILDTLSLLI